MKYVTRAHVKVDRVACPWLISRFVDSAAEFIFVEANEVVAVAAREGGGPFDIPGAELGHHAAECSFGAVIKRCKVDAPGMVRLALLSRALDLHARAPTHPSRCSA